jgi:hypothetical protein
MHSLIESKFKINPSIEEVEGHRALASYYIQTHHVHNKRKLRLEQSLFKRPQALREKGLMVGTIPFFEKLEKMYYQNLEINDSKFEVLLMHKKDQMGGLEKYCFSSLVKEATSTKEVHKKETKFKEDEKKEQESEDDHESSFDSYNNSSRRNSQTSADFEPEEPQDFQVDEKNFKSLFEEEEEPPSRAVFEIDDIDFEFCEKDQNYLEDTFDDLCQIQVIDQMINCMDDLRLTCKQNDIIRHLDFDLFKHNREEINYNGKYPNSIIKTHIIITISRPTRHLLPNDKLRKS